MRFQSPGVGNLLGESSLAGLRYRGRGPGDVVVAHEQEAHPESSSSGVRLAVLPRWLVTLEGTQCSHLRACILVRAVASGFHLRGSRLLDCGWEQAVGGSARSVVSRARLCCVASLCFCVLLFFGLLSVS